MGLHGMGFREGLGQESAADIAKDLSSRLIPMLARRVADLTCSATESEPNRQVSP